MNKKFIPAMLITVMGSVGLIETATAMIAHPQSAIPPFEYYRPNDPCFDHIKGYICNPPQASSAGQPQKQLVESEKRKRSAKKPKKTEDVNNYPW